MNMDEFQVIHRHMRSVSTKILHKIFSVDHTRKLLIPIATNVDRFSCNIH